MHHINKQLVATATATALVAVLGVAVAQSAEMVDPMATPQQQVDISGDQSNHIYFFRDQGYSPETDPAAHLLLIKHEQKVPVAARTTTTTTTVAETSTPAVDTTTTTTMPAADTSATETRTAPSAMPADTTPVLAPKADRN